MMYILSRLGEKFATLVSPVARSLAPVLPLRKTTMKNNREKQQRKTTRISLGWLKRPKYTRRNARKVRMGRETGKGGRRQPLVGVNSWLHSRFRTEIPCSLKRRQAARHSLALPLARSPLPVNSRLSAKKFDLMEKKKPLSSSTFAAFSY